MKRSWQVWSLYALALAVALPALAWLSMAALRLERVENAARAQAELDERVRLALWRMDSRLTPLVAQEMARPYFSYSPLPPTGQADDPFDDATAPLWVQPSEYVLLNFQVAQDGHWTSPQCPLGDDRRVALANGATVQSITEARQRLDLLSRDISYAPLAEQLPVKTLLLVPMPPVASAGALAGRQAAGDEAPQAQTPQAASRKASGDFQKRQEINTGNVSREYAQQRSNLKNVKVAPALPAVTEGLSRPVWLAGHLLVARRVTIGGEVLAQGCWLDWQRIERDLRSEVADLLGDFELQPAPTATESSGGYLLASLPVRLIPPTAAVDRGVQTPLRTALAVAWIALALAAVAVALLLAGVVALSERRQAFVSAVTHELRTPLTTFRLYAEMLDENMVTSEADRKSYLHTLRAEADRLFHLVENVLAYARLERGRLGAARERVTVRDLWACIEPRLNERARQAGMTLAAAPLDGAAEISLHTDPTAVEQILFNLVDNAAKYAAHVQEAAIGVQLVDLGRSVEIRVSDSGPGISAEMARRLFHPFSKSAQQAANSAPGVGLGLALSRRLARQLGGDLRHESADGHGATFVVVLPRA